MADRASSKRKFEVSNAPSNKRKKTRPAQIYFVVKKEHGLSVIETKLKNFSYQTVRGAMQQSGVFFSKIESKIPSTHKIIMKF